MNALTAFAHPEALSAHERAEIIGAPEIIDHTADWNDLRVRQGLPFQVRWNKPGHPSHYFRTLEAAEAAVADWEARA
jgi:hypothetical protein